MSRRRRRAARRPGSGCGGGSRGGPPEPPRPDAPPAHPLAGAFDDEPAAPGSEPSDAPPPADAASDPPTPSPLSPPDPAPNPHGHLPVLVAEVLTLLAAAPGDVVVDCTAGRGGHARRLAAAIGASGTLVLADLDAGNLAHAAERCTVPGGPAVIPLHARFDAVPGLLAERGLRADAVLADLGFASNQIDDPARGFSFAADGPLDMRLDPGGGPTAADLLARIPEGELADLLFTVGEEPLGRRIARNVVAAREREPIISTATLAELVRAAYGPRAARSRLHPATRTFMALRIAVNGELDAVEGLLSAIADDAETLAAAEDARDAAGPAADERAAGDGEESATWLRPGARVAVIAFHSLEDRAVKRAFRDLTDRGAAERLTRKPILASHAEVRANARARSARLRAVTIRRVKDRRPSVTAGDLPPYPGA